MSQLALVRIALLIAVVATFPLRSDTAQPVRRIYVGNFGGKPEADNVRHALMNQIRKSGSFELAESKTQADAVLDGTLDIYTRGYYSLYVRSGTSPANGTPVYGGYVSVELKDPNGETIWSYLSALHGQPTKPASDVARDIVKHLTAGRSSFE